MNNNISNNEVSTVREPLSVSHDMTVEELFEVIKEDIKAIYNDDTI